MPSRRVTLVADELRGCSRRAGGLGTVTTFLALALARLGHDVEVLYVAPPPSRGIEPEWARLYEGAGVSVRVLPRSGETAEPPYFARMRDVERALRADAPDVVITQDLAAPTYTALRLRHLGLAFENTLFVVFCHGTRRWVTDTSRKVRVLPGALAITVLEQASIELADVAVSPSAYMVEWMRGQGWKLPARTLVIPILTRFGARGESPPRTVLGPDGRVERIAFFGRLDERKGVRPFVAALNALGPLLEGIELEFLGPPTLVWTPERVKALLSDSARRSLRRVSFETDLDQERAFARLSQPGTLAVMPSLEDNSPNTIYECLERGIPFIASNAGGTGELIAPDDRADFLFEPTPDGIEGALRRALAGGDVLRPARPAFDAATSMERWADVVATPPREQPRVAEQPPVDVVIAHRSSKEALGHCLTQMGRQSYDNVNVIVVAAGRGLGDSVPAGLARPPVVVRSERASIEASREKGLEAGRSPWLVFLDEEDEPDENLVEKLVRAQGASGADVVTCGLKLRDDDGGTEQHFFLGEPGGLGLLSNGYGTVALLRRSLLGSLSTPWPVEGDADWPLLAGLSVSGARIVSIPIPLVTRKAHPGALERQPSDAFLVLEQLERALPNPLRAVGRVAADLAAGSVVSPVALSGGTLRRVSDVLRNEGLSELARRALRRVGGRS